MRSRPAQENATSATSAKQASTKPYIAFQAVISFFRFTQVKNCKRYFSLRRADAIGWARLVIK